MDSNRPPKNNATIAQFVYNGDGQKVKRIVNPSTGSGQSGETIYLVNGYYEKKGSEITKYYLAGASRVAMRKYTIPQSMELEFMLGDHLGSTSITTDATGAKVSEMRFKPWGEIRYSWTSGQSMTPAYKLPVYTFTGQRSYMDDPSTTGVEGFGLLDYNARMYDPALGRFVSADTIVPGGVQGLDRYAYVGNNPVRFTDPSGHRCIPADECETPHGDLADPLPLLKFATDPGQSFTDDEIQTFEADAQQTATALAQEINSGCSAEAHALGICFWVTSQQAFYAVFGGPITVRRVDDTCSCYAELKGTTHGNYTIWVYSNASTQDIIDSPGLLIHEMGHAFHHASGFSLDLPGGNALNNPFGLDPDYENHSSLASNEIFADMFTGWVYGKWEVGDGKPTGSVFTVAGTEKFTYMETNMPTYIQRAIDLTWSE